MKKRSKIKSKEEKRKELEERKKKELDDILEFNPERYFGKQ